MSHVAVEALIVGLLILANSVFAMSEIAILSARKVRLQQRAEQGDEGARMALELANSPGRFLSTIQIGITLIGILAGAFGGATLAEALGEQVRRLPLLAPYYHPISVGLVVLAITYLTLVVGELVPKQLALSNAERIAALSAPWMRALARLASPFVHLLNLSTNAILRVLRVRPSSEPAVTEEEVKLMIDQGAQIGVFEPTEQEMIERVFRLDDRSVYTLMTPRTEVVWIDLDEPQTDICTTLAASTHSYFPVGRGTLDNILGIAQAKDLLRQSLSGQPVDVEAVLQPALFVPEGMSALEVLERFRESRSHVALVVDEYGIFQGLVTLVDLLEAIVGDMPAPGEANEPYAVRREDGSWLLDGRMLIDDLKELLSVEQLPDEESGYYQTLGGLMMTVLERVPTSGDRFTWENLSFEVVDMDGLRVDKVLVTPASSTARDVAVLRPYSGL